MRSPYDELEQISLKDDNNSENGSEGTGEIPRQMSEQDEPKRLTVRTKLERQERRCSSATSAGGGISIFKAVTNMVPLLGLKTRFSFICDEVHFRVTKNKNFTDARDFTPYFF